jgi:hypothetical protein
LQLNGKPVPQRCRRSESFLEEFDPEGRFCSARQGVAFQQTLRVKSTGALCGRLAAADAVALERR